MRGNVHQQEISWTVPSMILLDDRPVEDSADDEFRFDGFAQSIARSILENKTKSSYSLGITGIWGAGKTSMLNLLKNYLRKDSSTIIIEFNARESADVKCIQSDFLTAVSNSLKKFHSGAQHVITDYMKNLRILANDTLWAKALDVVRLSNSETSKDSVEKIIEQIGKRIVILIDDFDRLTAEEILEVLKIIDKNGSFNKTFFISAYDKEYVNHVLNNHLKDNTLRDFTDKYFNIELRLPDRKQSYRNGYIQRRLYALVDNGTLKSVSKKDVDDALMYVVSHMNTYIPTPRDIKRYIGLTMASYLEVQDDVSLRDFLLVSLIKYKYSEEYEALYRQEYIVPNVYGTSYDTNFLLKEQKDIPNVKSYPILRILFPSSSCNDTNDKKFGLRHLSWKRSFDFYFFDLELGHISFRELKPIVEHDISLGTFKKLSSKWTSDAFKKDVADFVISRLEMVHSAQDFKYYFRLVSMARYYCPSHELFLHCGRLLVKNNLEENAKKINVSEKGYVDIVNEFICKGKEWVLSAIVIQDALHLCLKPGEELELIFPYSYFQQVAEERLQHVLTTFRAQRATSEDVYEVLKANIVDVDDSGYSLSPKALDSVRKNMINDAKLYYKDIIWNKPIPGKKRELIIGFHSHMPLRSLFKDKDQFCLYIQEVNKKDSNLVKSTDCLLDFYKLIAANNFQPVHLGTKHSNQNIGQCDFDNYYMILKGER